MTHAHPSGSQESVKAGLRLAAVLGSVVSCLTMTAAAAALPQAGLSRQLVRAYLWPDDEVQFRAAESVIEGDRSLLNATRQQLNQLEEWMRAGPDRAAAAKDSVGDALVQWTVPTAGGREVPVVLRLPGGYDPGRQWPLLLAMHGGPTSDADGALRGARRMINVWAAPAEAAGWIVVAPAMVDVVSRGRRTAERLPYEIFHPEEARAVLDAVRARYSVNPDRIVSTGISLGSNFSIAYAAAHSDWFSAIVPVSTEGDSRELLLRNLGPVPVYVLEGARDRNIRTVSGPRALASILTRFGFELVYREFSERAHEGFQEHYPDVLRWLDSRPRNTAPRHIVRVPHDGIVPPARAVHWLEADTRQAFVQGRVVSPSEIDIQARWAGRVTLRLNDRLVDLDRPLTVRVNGVVVHQGRLQRSVRDALEQARLLGDERRVYPALLSVPVPRTAEAVARAAEAWKALEPGQPPGRLSFWEMYAMGALRERVPSVGFEAVAEPLPEELIEAPEQIGLRVTVVSASSPAGRAGLRTGDLLVSFGEEPFFRDRGGAGGLYNWLIRELRETPSRYPLLVQREGRLQTLRASYRLGPYRPQEPQAGPR